MKINLPSIFNILFRISEFDKTMAVTLPIRAPLLIWQAQDALFLKKCETNALFANVLLSICNKQQINPWWAELNYF